MGKSESSRRRRRSRRRAPEAEPGPAREVPAEEEPGTDGPAAVKAPEGEDPGAAGTEAVEEVEAARGRGAEAPQAAGEEAPEAAGEAAAARLVQEELEEEAAVARDLIAELEELRDRHLRLAAEFENYRKRTRQELLKTGELAQAELAGRLLDALDDLDRVAEVSTDSTTVEALHEGIALVARKVFKELEEAGLEPIDAQGQRFDPTLHEALSAVPTDDPEEDEVVSRVFLRGYRFGDRLLRPARVEVKKYRPGEAPEGAAPGAGDGAAGERTRR